MKKELTYTCDFGNGEMNLIDTSMENIALEIEAMSDQLDESDPKDAIVVTIRIERRYSLNQLKKMPDYTG